MFRFKIPLLEKMIFVYRAKKRPATVESVKEYVRRFGPFRIDKKHMDNLRDRFNYFNVEKEGDCTTINVSCSLCKSSIIVDDGMSLYKSSSIIIDCKKCPLGIAGHYGCLRILDALTDSDEGFCGAVGTDSIFWHIQYNGLAEKQFRIINENYEQYVKFV